MKNSKGFTLVELLITMALVSIMLTIATTSFNQYSQFWQKEFGQYQNNVNKAKSLFLLNQSIENAAPYFVANKDNEVGGYFLGREEGFTLLTTAPMFAMQSGLSVIRIFKEQAEDGYKLVYEEAPLNNVFLKTYTQNLKFKFRVELLSAKEINFNYFGANSLKEKYLTEDVTKVTGTWRDIYDGEKTNLSPEKIAITIDSKRVEWELATESQRLWSASGAQN